LKENLEINFCRIIFERNSLKNPLEGEP